MVERKPWKKQGRVKTLGKTWQGENSWKNKVGRIPWEEQDIETTLGRTIQGVFIFRRLLGSRRERRYLGIRIKAMDVILGNIGEQF